MPLGTAPTVLEVQARPRSYENRSCCVGLATETQHQWSGLGVVMGIGAQKRLPPLVAQCHRTKEQGECTAGRKGKLLVDVSLLLYQHCNGLR